MRKKWENEMIPAGDALGQLALANDIVEKTNILNQGEVIAHSDNKGVLNIACKTALRKRFRVLERLGQNWKESDGL